MNLFFPEFIKMGPYGQPIASVGHALYARVSDPSMTRALANPGKIHGPCIINANNSMKKNNTA